MENKNHVESLLADGSDRSFQSMSDRPEMRDLKQAELDFERRSEDAETDSEPNYETKSDLTEKISLTMRELDSGEENKRPAIDSDIPTMPVRRLHNFVYCKRLFYFQWVENLFEENGDTVAGSALHKNVDRPSHWQEEMDLNERARVRSLQLESAELGLGGVIDLMEDDGEGFTILDYKKGSARRDEHGEKVAKEPDRVQVGAYALLLREVEGIVVERAAIYYAADRRRVEVEISEGLFQEVRDLLNEAQATAKSCRTPEPLVDDPRCLHCSAYPVCLPNESAAWIAKPEADSKKPAIVPKRPPRPPGDEGEILVVQDVRARVGIRAGEFVVQMEKSKIVSKHPAEQLHSIYLYGAVQISTQALQKCLEKGIGVSYFSPAGRFLGRTTGPRLSGVDARRGQYRLFEENETRLKLTREIVRAKIHNQRVLLMRNGDELPKSVSKKLGHLRDLAEHAETIDSVRGYEGAAAALYFKHFSKMLKTTGGEGIRNFDFDGRNRRPPRDPVNALLSQGYSILAKELSGVCESVGMDPFFGFFHQPRFGRPALALDLMEEFRPLIADSVTISLINRGELTLSDFAVTSRGTFLKQEGMRQFWGAWFRRMDTEVKHPEFGYKLSYRRMLEVQARQLWRFVRGEAETYHAFTTR